MKKILVSIFAIALLVSALTFFAPSVEAFSFRAPRRIYFPYKDEVVEIVNKALSPIQELIDKLTGRTGELEKRVAELEEKVASLEEIAHCPPGMVPEPQFAGYEGPLKCIPAANPQPTSEPPGPEPLQVSCGGAIPQDPNSPSEFIVTANKPLKSCQYSVNPLDSSEPESSNTVIPVDSSCSFTENNCDRQITVMVESFDNESGKCFYDATVCNP